MFYLTCMAIGAASAAAIKLLPKSWDKPLITVHNPWQEEIDAEAEAEFLQELWNECLSEEYIPTQEELDAHYADLEAAWRGE